MVRGLRDGGKGGRGLRRDEVDVEVGDGESHLEGPEGAGPAEVEGGDHGEDLDVGQEHLHDRIRVADEQLDPDPAQHHHGYGEHCDGAARGPTLHEVVADDEPAGACAAAQPALQPPRARKARPANARLLGRALEEDIPLPARLRRVLPELRALPVAPVPGLRVRGGRAPWADGAERAGEAGGCGVGGGAVEGGLALALGGGEARGGGPADGVGRAVPAGGEGG
eukprot:771632-Rhodomonas_salina.1